MVHSWISSIHPLVGRTFPCFQWVLEPRPTPCPWGFAVSPRGKQEHSMHLGSYPGGALKDCRLMIPKNHVQRNISNLNKKAAFRWLFWGEFQKNFRYAEYLLAFQIRITKSLQAWSLTDPSLHLCIPFCPMSRTKHTNSNKNEKNTCNISIRASYCIIVNPSSFASSPNDVSTRALVPPALIVTTWKCP